jgi:hypothetical protein
LAVVERRVRNGKTSYRVRYRDPAGRQRSKSFARKADAERWMIETENAKAKGSYVSPALGKTKLAEVAERWWATCAHLRPTTRITKEKPGCWTRRRAFEQVRDGSNIQLLPYSLVTTAAG